MRKGLLGATVVGATLAIALAGCSSSKSSGKSTSGGSTKSLGKVGIILPDQVSSPRWVAADPKALSADCKTANITCYIQNAQADPNRMKTIAEQMENEGVKVLMIVNLDSKSGAAIESEAKSKGVTTVDYDRLTDGGNAALYVSYNGVTVGQMQGQALQQCPQVKGKSSVNYVDLNGSTTDNNAVLFKQGYDSVLSKVSGWKKVDDQWVAGWDPTTASTDFSSILGAHPNINAVMVANDTMANSVIGVLKKNNLAGKVAVSGQDDIVQGLQNILSGNQCFTIYKPTAGEAGPAIQAISDILQGKTPQTSAMTKDPTNGREVPSILATPKVVTINNIEEPIKDGYVSYNDVCTAAFAQLCKAHNVTP